MSESHDSGDPVLRLVRRVRTRLWVRSYIRWSLRFVFGASVLALLWVVAARMFPELGDPFWPVVGLLAAGYVAGCIASVAKRPTLIEAALAADRGFGLRERVTSAIELSGVEGPMMEAIRADARIRIAGADPRRAFPMTIESRARWVYVLLLALGLAYVFLPEFDLFKHRARQAEADARREAVAVRVDRIRAAVDPLARAMEPGEASPVGDIVAELSKLSGEMESGALTQKQTIAKLENLAQKVAEHQKKLAEQGAMPKLSADSKEFGVASDVAKALQEGRLGDAMAEAKKLTKKMKEGKLSEQERKELAAGLKKLAEAAAASGAAMNESLAAALAQASASLESGDLKAASEAMEMAELSLEDIESTMKQLEKMNATMAYLSEWKGDLMGASEFCRSCGMKMSECTGGSCCTPGNSQCSGAGGGCANGSCAGNGMGPGLRGAGRGRGNRIGEQPEIEAGFQPTKATGPVTKGKMLADLLQRSAPEGGEEATVEIIQGSFEQLEQEAEQALTQEDIPPGAKEFVRQYFGDIDPAKATP